MSEEVFAATAGRDAVCRLCGGATAFCFTKLVLARHQVDYFRCEACGSVQTTWPTWLDEAYAFPGLHIDVGAPTRSIKNWLAAATLLGRLGFPVGTSGIDFGSGPGLFSALMRSSGFDFRTFDAYMPPMFHSDFHVGTMDGQNPDIVTAFEVFEHLPEPYTAITGLMQSKPLLLLFTTWPVDGQDENWLYFLPACGQHVFFYSVAGLTEIFEELGYRMAVSMYFYIAYDPIRLSPEQVGVVQDFCIGAVGHVTEALPALVGGVMMGNAHIDADFLDAGAHFSARLAETAAAREQRFGPALVSRLERPSAAPVVFGQVAGGSGPAASEPVDSAPPPQADGEREIADALAELTTRHARSEQHLAYLLGRSPAERLFFATDGTPVGPLRRLLFRRDGKVRRLLRRLVLDRRGRPRRVWRFWMTGDAYRALPKAHRTPAQPPLPPGGADDGTAALSPRTEHFLGLLNGAADPPPDARP